MATAHAKARLSKLVEEEDAELAIELVQFAYFKKVVDKSGKRKRRQEGSESEEEDVADDTPARRETPSKRKRSEEDTGTPSKKSRPDILQAESLPTPVNVDEERYKHFMGLLNKCVFEKNQATELEMSVIKAYMAKTERKRPFSDVSIFNTQSINVANY